MTMVIVLMREKYTSLVWLEWSRDSDDWKEENRTVTYYSIPLCSTDRVAFRCDECVWITI